MKSYKKHFSRFLEAAPGRLHFAAHSHHLWPDVTFAAQQRCWEDAARMADRKWEFIFGGIYPKAQMGCARLLKLRDPDTIAFGPNTHGFVLRILSALPSDRPIRVLTTDSEFHSFARQLQRLEEAGSALATRIATEPFESFPARFAEAANAARHDLIYLSHVFFNSGFVIPDLTALVTDIGDLDATIVIDGYHGFCALPTDLSVLAKRVFYLAGGYKYAMAGEGACFLHAPPGHAPRPRDTGWYAGFGALEDASGDPSREQVAYGTDATRFLGATFDPVGLYRLNAVMDLLLDLDITVRDIHKRVRALQQQFLEQLAAFAHPDLSPDTLVGPPSSGEIGHFLTFRTASAGALHRTLLSRDVVTDFRDDRLRIGFGLYHDNDDIEDFFLRIKKSK